MPIVHYLQNLTPARLWLLAIFVSMAMTELIVCGMELLLKGEISYDFLLTGFVASFCVAGFVVAALTFFIGQIRLEAKRYQSISEELDKRIDERKQVELALRAQEEIYRNLFNNTEVAMFRSRLDGSETLNANDKFIEIVGGTRAEVIGKPSLVYWVDRSLREEMVRRLEADGRVVDFEFQMFNKKGEVRDCITSLTLYSDEGILDGSIQDVTERKRVDAELHATNEKLTSLYKLSPIGIALTDMQGRYIEFNDAFQRICGYTREELNNLDYWALTPKEYAAKEAEQLESLTKRGYYGPYEKEFIRKEGDRIPLRLNGALITGNDGTQYIWSIVEDISDRVRHQEQLERIAHYDVLTGTPNRALLADRMKQAIAQTRREQNLMALCYLDLDGFKAINDTMGHAAGDQVLIEVSQRIMGSIRGGDTVARLGGDEFVVLMLGLDKGEECVATLERLLDVISQPIKLGHKSVAVGASIGVSIYPLDDEDADTLLRHADQAMYQAKQAGKNRFHIYDPELDQRARSHHAILNNVRQGLEKNEFVLYYQPKVDMKTKRFIGAEALIRWQHPEKGLLPPAEFLHAIENTDLDIAIGEWVISTALAQIQKWRLAGLDIEVSINISAFHLESADFVERLRQRVAKYADMPAHKLQIEVLETAALEDVSTVTNIIEACREFGVGFALDDFGTGYSSLTYLSYLPVDTLKIDQSFVRDMLVDKGDMAIVQGIIALAKAFDRQTVAEGIETENHYQVLLDMGCDLGQGFWISRPMPADELTNWHSTINTV